MSILVQLIADMDAALADGQERRRTRTLSRLTDLLERDSASFSPEQLEVFDGVIQRFADAIEERARVELAERLSRIPRSPRGIVRKLARQEISVARPLLLHSERLDDHDLIAVALDRGQDHMLAICERKTVSAPLSDVLVSRGDGRVHRKLAGNPGARLSEVAVTTLLEKAALDADLHGLLGDRNDLSEFVRGRLVELAEEVARLRLSRSLPGQDEAVAGAVGRSASALVFSKTGARDYEPALADLRALLAVRPLNEADMFGFASSGRVDRAILAIVSLTGLSISTMEPIFADPENDLLLMIGKSQGWSWRTVRALLQLRDPSIVDRGQLRRTERVFDELVLERAQRAIHFLKIKSPSNRLKAPHPQAARSQAAVRSA